MSVRGFARRIGQAIRHHIRRATGFYHLIERLKMIHADVQTQLDRTDTLIASIPGVVQAAVANAEAAKDSDHADDVAALTAQNDKLEAALAAINAPAAPQG